MKPYHGASEGASRCRALHALVRTVSGGQPPVENPVVHISLNPSPKDKLSDEQLERIAREYLKKLGYGNQPYIIYKHEDIGRPHLHILTTCITEQGRKINDFRIWKRSWSICRHLERKYGLHPAEKQDYSYRQPLTAVDYKASDLKRRLQMS